MTRLTNDVTRAERCRYYSSPAEQNVDHTSCVCVDCRVPWSHDRRRTQSITTACVWVQYHEKYFSPRCPAKIKRMRDHTSGMPATEPGSTLLSSQGTKLDLWSNAVCSTRYRRGGTIARLPWTSRNSARNLTAAEDSVVTHVWRMHGVHERGSLSVPRRRTNTQLCFLASSTLLALLNVSLKQGYPTCGPRAGCGP
jgi:hypothetical protein